MHNQQNIYDKMVQNFYLENSFRKFSDITRQPRRVKEEIYK